MRQTDKRRHVVFLIYLSEFYEKSDMEEQLELYFRNFTENLKDQEIQQIIERYKNVSEKLGVIDPMIAGVSEGWKLERMSKIDLAIMRMAVYEIYYDEDVPEAVAISEAVVLAMAYGGDDGSQAFINGILGKLEKNRKANE